MAESQAGAAEEAVEGISKIVVDVGGKISVTISSTSAQSVRDVCITAVTFGCHLRWYRQSAISSTSQSVRDVCITAVTLDAIYAGIGFYSTVKTSGLRPSVFTVE